MIDIVRIFENISIQREYQFHYGNESNLNLIDPNVHNQNLDIDKAHVLMFPPTRGGYNFKKGFRNYKGMFLLVLPDSFAQDYYNNSQSVETKDKFSYRIEPLIDACNKFERDLYFCEGFEILDFNSVEVVDLLDANFSGLRINYSLNRYE